MGLAQGRVEEEGDQMALSELVQITDELSLLAERLKDETHAETRAWIHRRAFYLLRQIMEASDHE